MHTLALKHLDHKTTSFEDLAGKGAKQLTFNQIEIEKGGFYAAEDADITLQLHLPFWPQPQAIPALEKVSTEIEMPALPVLFAMEETGTLLDADLLHEQSLQIGQRLQQLEEQAHNTAGRSEERRVGKECRSRGAPYH